MNNFIIKIICHTYQKKRASYLHHTAQPLTLATFQSWGSSVGAGCVRLAHCKYILIAIHECNFLEKNSIKNNNI